MVSRQLLVLYLLIHTSQKPYNQHLELRTSKNLMMWQTTNLLILGTVALESIDHHTRPLLRIRHMSYCITVGRNEKTSRILTYAEGPIPAISVIVSAWTHRNSI